MKKIINILVSLSLSMSAILYAPREESVRFGFDEEKKSEVPMMVGSPRGVHVAKAALSIVTDGPINARSPLNRMLMREKSFGYVPRLGCMKRSPKHAHNSQETSDDEALRSTPFAYNEDDEIVHLVGALSFTRTPSSLSREETPAPCPQTQSTQSSPAQMDDALDCLVGRILSRKQYIMSIVVGDVMHKKYLAAVVVLIISMNAQGMELKKQVLDEGLRQRQLSQDQVQQPQLGLALQQETSNRLQHDDRRSYGCCALLRSFGVMVHESFHAFHGDHNY